MGAERLFVVGSSKVFLILLNTKNCINIFLEQRRMRCTGGSEVGSVRECVSKDLIETGSIGTVTLCFKGLSFGSKTFVGRSDVFGEAAARKIVLDEAKRVHTKRFNCSTYSLLFRVLRENPQHGSLLRGGRR